MNNKREILLDDVIEYQQQNQALMQTILWRLDQANPTEEDTLTKYVEILGATQKLFDYKLRQ